MTTTIGVRDLARSANILQEYDYVHIEDKKTHEYKGIFVSPKYAKEFESFLLEKSNRQKQERLKALESICGSMTGLIGDESVKELKASYTENKYGK